MNKIMELLNKASTDGLPLPVAHDASRKEASVTLFFMYLANLLAVFSLIYLHIKADAFVATLTTAIYSIVWTVLYMMRRIQKAKFDLDDREIDLEGGNENP